LKKSQRGQSYGDRRSPRDSYPKMFWVIAARGTGPHKEDPTAPRNFPSDEVVGHEAKAAMLTHR